MNKFDKEIEDYLIEYVKELPDEEFAYNQLEHIHIKRQKLIRKLKERAIFTRLSHQLDSALIILYEEGLNYFNKEEYVLLIKDFLRAEENLANLDVTKSLSPDVQAVLQISSTSLGLILKIAMAKFNENQFSQSLALFALLTAFAPGSSAYWFRLGIVAQRCEDRDLALSAYSVSSMLDPSQIGAQIFSAECHLMANAREEAQVNCIQARNIMKTTKVEEIWPPLLSEIESVLAER
jgi:hypothetical protein